jgi:hypothetical protein
LVTTASNPGRPDRPGTIVYSGDEPAGGLSVPGSRSSTPTRDTPDRTTRDPDRCPSDGRARVPPTTRPGGRGPRTLPPALRGPLNRSSPVPFANRKTSSAAASLLLGPAGYCADGAPIRPGWRGWLNVSARLCSSTACCRVVWPRQGHTFQGVSDAVFGVGDAGGQSGEAPSLYGWVNLHAAQVVIFVLPGHGGSWVRGVDRRGAQRCLAERCGDAHG